MKLTISFQGKVTVDIDDISVIDGSGIVENLSNYTALELEQELEKGKLFITLAECLDARQGGEIELFNYDLED